MYQYNTQNNIFVASFFLWFYKYFPNQQRLFRHASSYVRGPLDGICSHLARTPKRKISARKITTKGVKKQHIYTVQNVLHKKVAFLKNIVYLFLLGLKFKSHLETNR